MVEATTREHELAEAFTRARPRLVRVAYAVIGSTAEAEDVVSECWLRLAAADEREPIRDLEGWAIVAVARGALDVLRSARVRREAYVVPWLPEPVVEDFVDPADRVTLDESVSFALMVMLETLSPAERTSWVLHDLFGMPFDEVAAAVGRSTAAVRQLASRARAHVAAGAPRVAVDPAEHEAAVSAFVVAAASGDLNGLVKVLDPEVVLTSDGGGQRSAARRPVHGADRVARFLLGIAGKVTEQQSLALMTVNGSTGLVLLDGDSIYLVASFTVVDGLVTRVDLVLAPDKLPAPNR